MSFNNNSFSTILYAAIIAFFGAIAKEINDKSKDKTESFPMFFGEVFLHGFSGWIVGLIAIKYLGSTDITSITIYAGVGGLFGYDLAKVTLKFILKLISNAKSIEIDDKFIDKKETTKKTTKKRKKE
jgi:hypothetical protein